jgi:hypothetical protein
VTKLWGNSTERAAAAERLPARAGPADGRRVRPVPGRSWRAPARSGGAGLGRLQPQRAAQRAGNAYLLLTHMVGRDLDEWERVAEILDDWGKAIPGDARIGSWRVALAANR